MFIREEVLPTLDFKGKPTIYSHHLGVPFRDLEIDSKKSLQPKGARPSLEDNLIIHGDNLHALKALLPRYAGKIKCIYIDPPYNTGNEGWKYNDNVNSPSIKDWLDKEVGVDDLERHDKWLCMMWPRLQLLKELLSDDGIIFTSIDSNEQHRLITIMDEIFGEENFLCTFTWPRKKKGSFLSKEIKKMTEFIVCYRKTESKLNLYGEDAYSNKWQPIVKRTNSKKKLKFPSHLIKTKLPDNLYKKGFRGSEGTGIDFLNNFTVKDGIITTNLEVKGKFIWTQDFLDQEINNNSQFSLSNKFGFNVLRHDQDKKIKAPSTLINHECGVGTNEDATEELIEIFKSTGKFNYNKPKSLIKFLITTITNGNKKSIILDSFAGSGTTAHAVLNLNKEDGGNRKFILVECEDYADKITAERVRRVIKGIPKAKDENLKKGLGGSFTYCTLGKEINEENLLREKKFPSYEVLAKYVFYTATGQSIDKIRENEDYFISKIDNNIAFFMIYKPNKKFLRSNDSALNLDRKEKIEKLMKQKKCAKAIVFAPVCFYPIKELSQSGIRFCQLPFDIHRIIGRQ